MSRPNLGKSSQDDPPSSFPVSSPTFWAEAAKLDIGDGGAGHNGQPSAKRRRLSPPPLSLPRSPLARMEQLEELAALQGPSGIPERERSPGTTLSYLPNRADPFADLSSHSYLAGAEYAPNKFGDIGDYMRKKEIKVQTQNRDIALADPAAANLPQIFKDLSFYINGNTHPPMEEIRKMILQRGGEVRPVLRSKGMVKYIIAPMLTQMKFKQFVNYKVVREGWILESCKEGKLLDWTRWKLAVQGGWEEEGRKGLEGFFKGEPTQRAKREREEEEEEEEEEEVEERSAKQVDMPGSTKVTSPPPAPVVSSSTKLATPSKLQPVDPFASRQSPVKPPTPKKETPKRAETQWEFYASKESNEDAARLLKDQEWRLKNTAERGNEGGFIDGYYQNSRLHHLSTWKTELRVLVATAQRQSEENSLAAPAPTTLSHLSLSTSVLPTRAAPVVGTGQKYIFHVDFDCFFVSCGLATRPHLCGKPSVVCHSTGGRMEGSTSEIASASYEARAKGVKNGMSLGRARTLVGEDLLTIPYEFETYKKYSLAFYTVLMGYADELQAVSVDEALIDATSAVAAREAAPEEADEDGAEKRIPKRPRDAAVEIAQKIRDDIRKETGCEVSIGISHNVFLSKLATRRAKPAGVYHLTTAEIPTFLAPLDVEDFPSVGYSIKSKIEEKFGTTIAGELMEHPKGAFRGVLGPKTGEMVWGYLRGMDDRKLEPHKERKSISAEMNYGIRFRNDEQAEICVRDLAAEVAKRMKQVNAKGRLLTLKIMKRHPEAPIEPPKFLGHGWCETFNKSSSVGTKGGGSTDDPEILGVEAVKLLRTLGLDPVELRGVGIQMTKLDGEKAEREAGQGAEREPPPISRSALPNASAGPSRLAPAASSDGIDPDFLAALPEDLQREIRAEHARARAAKKAPLIPVKPTLAPAKPLPRAAPGRHSAAHISKQLRPKTKTQMKAGQIADLALYSAWNKAKAGELDPTSKIGLYFVKDLCELGIDPTVFSELPSDMQKEVITEERRKQRQRLALHRPADTSRIRAKEREADKSKGLGLGFDRASTSPRGSRAGSLPVTRPAVVRPESRRPAMLNATKLPDVLDTITKWVDSRGGKGPAERDAKKVEAYLVKLMEPGVGLGGVEAAIECLKWLKVILGERWKDEADRKAGKEWWDTWRRFLGSVSKRCEETMGAPIRL
ncbi:uncharacterized protein MKK02DRAFT_18867 [Dioszegia hungarica]|uniref:DNA repair protein REV1 n=1 Tax=Dioszegia hungarica TaxID=4972 RepID=A0AA38HDM1_9TREE|nr:uncharacterized protein MKK02DRAFT_18867 [Dioszegia hungarica]KAI9639788.1 hypothetical protein MKK02DRAFT_18867 [Dioszegia hungarica]